MNGPDFMTDIAIPTNAKIWWRPTWRMFALWLALWLPWLYLGVFAYSTSFTVMDPGSPLDSEIREFGWPNYYLASEKDLSPLAVGATFQRADFVPWMLLVNLLVSIVIASILIFACCKWFAAIRRRGFRFRLSTLLILILVLSLLLAGWRYLVDEYSREEAIIAQLAKLGISVTQSDEPLFFRRLENILPERMLLAWRRVDLAYFEFNASEFEPQQASELLGQLKYLYQLQYPYLYNANELLQVAPLLPSVREIYVEDANVNDEGLEQLKKCQWLTKIELYSSSVSAEQLKQLREALPSTEIISEYEETNE